MDDEVIDVTIVGGGDSGLLAGLCLRQLNPGLEITIVDDFERDVPQVGKSTYKKITEILHDFLDVDEERFVSEVKPVWKGTVYFRDWCGNDPFHFPFDDFAKFPAIDTPDAVEAYYLHYEELYDSPEHLTTGEAIVEQSKSPMYFVPSDGMYHKYDHIAYHLNTDRFNAFLRKLCKRRGIDLVNDEVTGVVADGNRVERVESAETAYEADLYVDASGFNRVLKGELDADFRDFDFPLDAAYNARADRGIEDIVPATVIDSGEHGWFWQIDTYDDRDLGYVYGSAFVSDEEALETFLEHCGGGVAEADVARYEFTSGYHERAWEGNCVAIGNAQGFVEPLQSTGLTANAEAAVTLSNLLSAHGRINDEAIRDTYNGWVRRSWESIYDFISVHYRYAAGDNEFWEAARSIDVSPRVERLVEEFDRNGFSTCVNFTENTPGVEDLLVFHPVNFYVMLRNLGVDSRFYERHDFAVSDEVRREREEYYRNVREEVRNYLSTQEVYQGIPELAGAD
jgi:tryptophan halogenase